MIITRSRLGLGIILLILSATAFSVSVIAASFALKKGIDVSTSNAVRYLMATVMLLVFAHLRGRSLFLPPRQRYIGLGLGIPVFLTGFGYIGATQYIPVSLAVLIFYTSPFLVAIMARYFDNDPFTLAKMVALITAFMGLMLTIEFKQTIAFDWRGIGYAFMGAMGAALVVAVSSHTMRTADTQALNLHCVAAGAVVFTIFALITGVSGWPEIQSCWPVLAISSLAITVGYITVFAGIEILGSVRSAMLMNLEPVITIMLAVLLLGEKLGVKQVLGAGLVLMGIYLITRQGKAVT